MRTPEELLERFNFYVSSVLDGTIPACKFIKQSVQRHLKDLDRAGTDDFPYIFDWTKGSKPCRFAELMPHVQGVWENPYIVLEPWQIFIYGSIFGWVHKDTGLRRFRVAYIEVPRKNAKSTKAAILANYMAFCDDEPGAQVYSAASNRKQAKASYDAARDMVLKSPQFRTSKGIKANSLRLYQANTGSYFEPLAKAVKGGGGNHDSLNVHLGIIDELHAHKTQDMWDVINSALGSRRQPLIFAITTAGSDMSGICYQQRSYLTKILSGVFTDETTFGMIFTIDSEDDPFDPAVWPKANPNWGVSVMPNYIEATAQKARQLTSARAEFLKKHLNVWGSSDEALFDPQEINACQDPSLKIEDMKDGVSVVGVDLANKIDFAAVARVFKRKIDEEYHYYAFCDHYSNEKAIEEHPSAAVKAWVEEGRIHVNPGPVTSERDIEEKIREHLGDGATEVAFDPAFSWGISQSLTNDGLDAVEYRMNVRNLSEPTKTLQAIMKQGRFHFNDPVLGWMLSNVVGHYDAKEMVFPKKELTQAKIDAAIAVIIGIGRLLLVETDAGFVFC